MIHIKCSLRIYKKILISPQLPFLGTRLFIRLDKHDGCLLIFPLAMTFLINQDLKIPTESKAGLKFRFVGVFFNFVVYGILFKNAVNTIFNKLAYHGTH